MHVNQLARNAFYLLTARRRGRNEQRVYLHAELW
jgi:hypothetical protein